MAMVMVVNRYENGGWVEFEEGGIDVSQPYPFKGRLVNNIHFGNWDCYRVRKEVAISSACIEIAKAKGDYEQ
ncbi:hypothetical protein L1987_79806 [Smallanthus sonchifolius]|uniref:Uncharacterized protein n=1 Tax=Smallanthus sonchifolius TaxID=185202 RepID=A0ACB8YLZ9_9ASTR|nr:hypothetical protein L1987_79806 [Smallanthus sonchifolius]